MTPVGFPHSEISGLAVVCTYPELIAACHVLLRLPTPRHPPCALNILICIIRDQILRYAALKVRTRPEGRDKARPEPRKPDTVRCARTPSQIDDLVPGRRVNTIRRPKIRCLRRCHKWLPRKEVIQPHLPVRLPCYDFTPLTPHTFGASLS